MYVSLRFLFLDFLFSRTASLFYWKKDDDDDDSCIACVRQSLETQMATFFYSFLVVIVQYGDCLLQKSPHTCTPPSLFIHLLFFSVSILCVAISERLLLLLMGDVNHRCAHKKKKKKKKKKHVHSTSRGKAKEREDMQ